MGILARSVALVALVAGTARAQSINVSFGHTSGAPSASYGAAGAAGTWNAVTGISGASFPALVAIDGTPTGVTVSQSPTTTVIATADTSVQGDDAALLNAGLITTGAETCLMFSGVTPGDYEVLVYAWVPNQPAVLSRTRQDEAPATIDVGGAWSGAHVVDVTYARYYVTVGTNGQLPAHSGLVPGQPSAALNGVQFRPVPAGGIPDAGPGGGGGGDDAGTGGGPTHHGGCRTSGGDAGALVALALVAFARRRRR